MSLQTVAQKYIQMMPKSPDGKTMPMPRFVTANMLSANWNGLAIWDGRSETCTVKVQKRIMADPRTLDRIVAHEICHAWAYWMVWLQLKPKPWCRGHAPAGGWAEAADLVNLREGDDFVTETSDETYAVVNDKQFYVFMTRAQGQIMWAWFSRVTPLLLQRLERRIYYSSTKGAPIAIFKTQDTRFLLRGGKLPHVACYEETPVGFGEVLDAHLKRYGVSAVEAEGKADDLIRNAQFAGPSKVAARPRLVLSWR